MKKYVALRHRCASRRMKVSPQINALGLGKIPSFTPCIGLLALGLRRARCQSSYIAFFLYKGPGTSKNTEFSRSIQVPGLGRVQVVVSPHKDPGTWTNYELLTCFIYQPLSLGVNQLSDQVVFRRKYSRVDQIPTTILEKVVSIY